MSSFSARATVRFIHTMYLFVILMTCCLSYDEGSVCLTVKPGLVKVIMGRQETAILPLTAVFFTAVFHPSRKLVSAFLLLLLLIKTFCSALMNV